MKTAFALFLLLLLAAFSFSQYGIPGGTLPGTPAGADIPATEIGGMAISPVLHLPAQPCEGCPPEAELPFLFSSLDESQKKVSTSMAVERAVRREPVEGATVFFQISDETGTPMGTCRAYTDRNGTAEFLYGSYHCAKGCTVRVLFCCSNPVTQKCALAPCLGTAVDDFMTIPPCSGGRYGGEWPSNTTVAGNDTILSPVIDTVSIPAEETSATALAFTFCLPVLAVFGLLGAAMFASGRDPFAMFSFYTPRYTRGAERPIGPRGVTVNIASIANLLAQVGIKGIIKPIMGASQKAGTTAAAAPPEPRGGRVPTTPMATPARPGAPSLARPDVGAHGQPAPAAAQPRPSAPATPSQAPDSGRAGVLTGIIGQDFVKALFALLFTGDASLFKAFFAQFHAEPSMADAGMGYAEFFARLGSTLLQYMIPIWALSRLATDAIDEALAKTEVVGDRNRMYCEKVIPALDRGTTVLRDRNGDVTGYKIDFVNPLTHHRVSLTLNKEEGERFFNANEAMPQRIANIYIANQQVESNRMTVEAVAADFRRNCGAMAEQDLREYRATASGATEDTRAAIDTLLNKNSSQADKIKAFETISHDAGAASDAAILAATILSSGMSYNDVAALAGRSTAFRTLTLEMSREDFSARAGAGDGGNLVTAICIAKATFANILDTREGEAREQDSLRLGFIVNHLAGEIAQSQDVAKGLEGGHLQYRTGTNEEMAHLAIAGSIAGTAAASGVAGMSSDDRQEVQEQYKAIIQAREDQLGGRQMTEKEIKEFEPTTADGRAVFAKIEAIERYDTECRQVAATVNEIRTGAMEPVPAGTSPEATGQRSAYGAILLQAVGAVAPLADAVRSGEMYPQQVPEDVRGRVNAYIALGMLGEGSTALASQATAAGAEGERMHAVSTVANEYAILRMDMPDMTRAMAEEAGRNAGLQDAEFREKEAEVESALDVLGRDDATLGERQNALRKIGEAMPRIGEQFGGTEALADIAGKADYKDEVAAIRQQYNQYVEDYASSTRQQWNEIHLLETASAMLGMTGGPSDADWNEWKRTMIGYEHGRVDADNTAVSQQILQVSDALAKLKENPDAAQYAPMIFGEFAQIAGTGFKDALTALQNAQPGSAEAATALDQMGQQANIYFDNYTERMAQRLGDIDKIEEHAGTDVIRDHTFAYIEDIALGRASGTERQASGQIEDLEKMAKENQAMQLAQAQSTIQTPDDVKVYLDRAIKVEQEVRRNNEETELGALIPREETEYGRAARRQREARQSGRVPEEEIPR